jgi:hypothetical protein
MSTWIIGVVREGIADRHLNHEPEAFALRSIVRVALRDGDQGLQDCPDLMLFFSDDPGQEPVFLYSSRIVDERDFANEFREAHKDALAMNRNELEHAHPPRPEQI